MAMLNTKDRPVHAIAEDLAAGVYTSAELTADYIARVEKEDNVIKAFLKLDKEAVMLAAEESDRRRGHDRKNPERKPAGAAPAGRGLHDDHKDRQPADSREKQ